MWRRFPSAVAGVAGAGGGWLRGCLTGLALTAATACTGSVAQNQTPSSLPPDGAALAKLAERRVFFGHQSVGGNLLDGLRDLLRDQPGAKLTIVESSDAKALEAPALAHALVGQNEQPESKLTHFRRIMDAGMARSAEIAFFKFCYIDFNAGTDVEALFAKYRQTFEALEAAHPATTFVHVTVPLTTVQRGLKGWLKNKVGKAAWGERENIQRHRFNELLRATYGSKGTLFDLAATESVDLLGNPERFERDGRSFPSLVPGFTDDGEHLNAAGRRHAARKWVAFLADLPKRAGAPATEAGARPAP